MNPLLPTLLLLLSLPFAFCSSADFVIVGAGTSGCVLASRLCTQLPNASILLLERGLPRDQSAEFIVRAARNTFSSWTDPRVSEAITTLPNPGLNNRSITQFTGNTLGGSSSLNAMEWTVPIASSINSWRINGLSSKTSRNYYQRAFRQVKPQVPAPSNKQRYSLLHFSAAARSGFPDANDPFDMQSKDAIWENVLAAENGRRRDSCTAYLTPVLNTACGKNLQLVQGATVRKILTEKERGSEKVRATGLEYIHSSDRNQSSVKTVQARSEILLAAGPYGSPKLLQLSGIGPKDLLKKLQIPQVVDIPVGERTQGRALALVPYKYSNLPVPPENDPTLLESRSEMQRFEKGLPSVFNIAVSFMNGVAGKLGYLTGGFLALDPAGVGKPSMFQACFANPSSFGSLRVKSKDPFESPEVHLNLLNKRGEVWDTELCLKRIDAIANNYTKPVTLTRLVNETGEEFLRSSAGTAFHFVGGCAVGSVLNGDFKVYGMEGLRVVDASVIREIPLSAGPLASTYMIAEYASDKLIQEYGRKDRKGQYCRN